jgi:glycerophosphoryl diester phosphodiesterase
VSPEPPLLPQLLRQLTRPLLHPLQRSARHLLALPARYLVAAVVLHTIVVLGLGTLLHAMMDAALALASITGLTDGNVLGLVQTPASLALVVAIALLATAATFLYAALLFAIADLQLAGVTASLRTLARRTLAATRTLLHVRSALTAQLLALLLLVIAPFAGFRLLSPLTTDLALPPFILREFLKTTGGTIGWTLLILALLYLTFRTILALPLTVVAATRPSRSLRTAVHATGRDGIPLAMILVLAFGALWALSRITTEFLAELVDVAAPALPDPQLAIALASLVLTLLSLYGTLFFALILVGHAREVSGVASRSWPATAALRSATLRNTTPSNAAPGSSSAPGTPAADTPTRRPASLARHPLVLIAAATAALAIASATMAHTSAAYAGTPGDALVIGHRGYDSGGVENTISSLEAAAEFNPDFVEFDVQQTSDGGFVATHDTNLLILAGVNSNIYEITTAEATSTTVRMKGNSDTIPTMAEFVTRASELGMPLLIEIKTHGHEQPGFVADALAELDSLGALSGDNTFQSTNQDVVAEINRLHPELRVGYTIGILRGDPPTVECDFYTIEQASYTSEFLEAAHAQGREVYIWTVNGDVAMRSLLRDGVDGLVTDRIGAAEHFRARISSGAYYSPGDARDELLAGYSWD